MFVSGIYNGVGYGIRWAILTSVIIVHLHVHHDDSEILNARAVLFAKATVIENTLFGYLKVKTQVSAHAQVSMKRSKVLHPPPEPEERRSPI